MFPRSVTNTPALGSIGSRVGQNPLSSVFAGNLALVAGLAGAIVGRMYWIVAGATALAVQNGVVVVPPNQQPAGFLANEQQALSTIWLQQHNNTVPSGRELALFDGGDFRALCTYQDVKRGQKVFVNIFSGELLGGATGSFPTLTPGTPAAFVGNLTAGSTTLTVPGAPSSGQIEAGQQLLGPGFNPVNVFIDHQLTGTPGGAGTYALTQPAAVAVTGGSFTTTIPEGIGGTTGGQASFATNIMTVTTPPASGALAVGQLVQSAGVAPGTYITDQIDATHYHLSTAPGTITAQNFSTSAWLETTWAIKSDAIVGDPMVVGSTSGLGALAPSSLL